MNLVSKITLLISALTLIMVGIELFVKTKQRKIDRQIEVTIVEHRRMQQELFKNVIGILEIDRETQYEKFLKEKNILFHEALNFKVGVWINLNRENRCAEDLRNSCNTLVTCIADFLEDGFDQETYLSYNELTNHNRQKIWGLIDKYIEEEDKLNKKIVTGKK